MSEQHQQEAERLALAAYHATRLCSLSAHAAKIISGTLNLPTLLAAQQELKVANLKNRSSLANNLCPDHRDKQAGKPCLACEIETLKASNEKRLAVARAAKDALAHIKKHPLNFTTVDAWITLESVLAALPEGWDK